MQGLLDLLQPLDFLKLQVIFFKVQFEIIFFWCSIFLIEWKGTGGGGCQRGGRGRETLTGCILHSPWYIFFFIYFCFCLNLFVKCCNLQITKIRNALDVLKRSVSPRCSWSSWSSRTHLLCCHWKNGHSWGWWHTRKFCSACHQSQSWRESESIVT